MLVVPTSQLDIVEFPGEIILAGPLMDPEIALEIGDCLLKISADLGLGDDPIMQFPVADQTGEETVFDTDFCDIIFSERHHRAIAASRMLFEQIVGYFYGNDHHALVEARVGAVSGLHPDGSDDSRGIINTSRFPISLAVESSGLVQPKGAIPGYTIANGGEVSVVTYDPGYSMVINNHCPPESHVAHAGIGCNDRSLLQFYSTFPRS